MTPPDGNMVLPDAAERHSSSGGREPALGRGRANARILGRLDGLLTQERLRVYPCILLVLFGLFFAFRVLAKPSDTFPDYWARWTAGNMLVNGRTAQLYDPTAQALIQRSHGVPDLSWFVSPPPVALGFAPLGALPYAIAAMLWAAITLVGLTTIALLLRPFWSPERGPYWAVILICVASQPVLELVGAGQDSWLILLSCVGAWRLWLAQRPGWAGIALAVGCLFKPQLMLAALVLMVIYGGIRMLGGLLLGVAVGVIPTLIVLGPQVWLDWYRATTSSVFTEQVTIGQAYKAVSIQGFVVAALAHSGATHFAAYLGLALGLALLIAWGIWLVRRRPAQWAVLSSGAFVTVLAAPHALVYDLVIVLPSIALVLCHRPSPRIRVAVAAAFVLAWIGPALSLLRTQPWPASTLSAQWVVLVLFMLTFWLMRLNCSLPDKPEPVGANAFGRRDHQPTAERARWACRTARSPKADTQ